MDTAIMKVRGSWLIINGKRIWIRDIDEEDDE